MHKWIMILFIVFTFIRPGHAQTPDISFMQEDKIPLQQAESNYYEIIVKPKPFTILFNGSELHVCAGLDQGLFHAATSKTDINKDFSSPFFIFKYAALPKNGDYLVLYKDGANSLNKSHGAIPFKGNHQYTVSSIMNGNNQEPVSKLKQLFLALWLDDNKDQYIDDNELLRVKVNIEKN